MSESRIERHGEHDVYVLEDSETGSTARVLPDYGFNCYSFRCRIDGRELELLRSHDHFADQPSRASGNGTPILFPFPNRIRGGKFEFGGKPFQLPCNERGVNAIHGLVIDRRWRVVSSAGKDAAVTGQFQVSRDAAELRNLWPADFLIELTYKLDGNRLATLVRITNPDSRPLPWGFGTHPYFRLPLIPQGDPGACAVVAPVAETWELQDLLPTGRRLAVSPATGLDGRRPFSELKFDTVFTKLQFIEGLCTCRLVDRDAGVAVVLQFDRMFRELVIYTPPDRGAICLEPYTCVTDAINLQPRGVDAGLQVLAPGETVQATITLEIQSLQKP
jgi:aldose 1-epimerase